MKLTGLAAILASVLAVVSCGDAGLFSKKAETQQPVLATEYDSLSYALGYDFAKNWMTKGVDSLNAQLVQLAVQHAFMQDSLWLNEAYLTNTPKTLEKQLVEKQNQMRIQEGVDFLLANEKREEVTSLPSGLQYEVLRQGNGPKPTAADQVTTHYEGRLIDGTVFDSSYKRGQPATFPLRGVIRGWTEALQLMPVGSKYRLYIPYELAYGARGAGPLIQPYSTLIFDVELLNIVE